MNNIIYKFFDEKYIEHIVKILQIFFTMCLFIIILFFWFAFQIMLFRIICIFDEKRIELRNFNFINRIKKISKKIYNFERMNINDVIYILTINAYIAYSILEYKDINIETYAMSSLYFYMFLIFVDIFENKSIYKTYV